MVLTMLVLFMVLVGSAWAQDEFNDAPTTKWTSIVPPMGYGNGITVSNDSQVVYATSTDGTVSAMDPDDGKVNWKYKPPAIISSAPQSCNGEVAIAENLKFLVYGVSEGNTGEDKTCRVVALGHPAGDLVWISPQLEGECAGTPAMSGDGSLIYLTTNSNSGTSGHFSILAYSSKGAPLLSQTTPISPYSPVGIVTDPVRGNFDGGSGNTQDVIIWSLAPDPDTSGDNVTGIILRFQLSQDYITNGSTANFEVATLRQTSWRSTTAPNIVSQGLDMYWSVSRSSLRAWNANSTSTDTNSTDTNSTGAFDQESTAAVELPRGDPSWIPPFAQPQVDNTTTPTVLCVGAASANFYCLKPETLETIWSTDTDSLIKAEARFSTKGDRVYFIEEDGTIWARQTDNGDVSWEENAAAAVRSNFDLSIDGAYLYYGDETGNVVALQLASSSLPPVDPQSAAPSAAPSTASPANPTASSNPASSAPALPTTPFPTPGPTTSGALQAKTLAMIGMTSASVLSLLL